MLEGKIPLDGWMSYLSLFISVPLDHAVLKAMRTLDPLPLTNPDSPAMGRGKLPYTAVCLQAPFKHERLTFAVKHTYKRHKSPEISQ